MTAIHITVAASTEQTELFSVGSYFILTNKNNDLVDQRLALLVMTNRDCIGLIDVAAGNRYGDLVEVDHHGLTVNEIRRLFEIRAEFDITPVREITIKAF